MNQENVHSGAAFFSVHRQHWPDMLSEIDKATLKPGSERWVGDTVFKGVKPGPNDPCPCCSARNTRNAVGGDNIDPFSNARSVSK
jgi:hypothetical protein